MNRLPEYRASLEERYPVLCARCAPSVHDEIRRRDLNASATILDKRIAASRQRGRTTEVVVDPRQSWAWLIAGTLWLIRGSLWALCILATFALWIIGKSAFLSLSMAYGFTEGTLSPSTLLQTTARIKQRFVSPYSEALCIVVAVTSLLLSVWQPLWNAERNAMAAASDPKRVKVIGTSFWTFAQTVVSSLRLLFLVGLARSTAPLTLSRLALGSCVLSVLVCSHFGRLHR